MKSKPIRDSARGQRCTMQIVGVCNGNPETTILAHLPDESHGMAKKADDISSCYACSACHDATDGVKSADVSADDWHEFQNHKEWYMRRAMVRTWRKLFEQGLLTIKGAK